MFTWIFDDKKTGEEFFVEAEVREEAMKIAKEYFDNPQCYGTIPDYIAEAMGYDTYQEEVITYARLCRYDLLYEFTR